MKLEFQLSGHFTLTAVDANTGETRELASFENLVLNNGLEQLGADAPNILNYVVVGSGSSTPVVTQTTLDSVVASTQTQQSQENGTNGSSPYYTWTRTKWRFAQGEAAGNLSEVGIGPTPTSLFSRSLIKDAGGSPTTVTVLATEYLDVQYELRVYVPTADVVTNNVAIGGTSYTITARAAYCTEYPTWSAYLMAVQGIRFNTGNPFIAYDGSIGAVSSAPAGNPALSDGGATNNSYSNASHKRTGNIYFGLNNGNLTNGIKSMLLRGFGWAFQVEFSSAIPKDASKTLTLNLEVSWARRA